MPSLQPTYELPDPPAPHPAAGSAGDAAAHGHLRQERLHRGGAGARGARQEIGEETWQHSCHCCKLVHTDHQVIFDIKFGEP